jgi:hypothetical protein
MNPKNPPTPAQVSAEALRVAAVACDEILCGRCLGMDLALRPFYNGAAYQAVALCKTCGFAEEV